MGRQIINTHVNSNIIEQFEQHYTNNIADSSRIVMLHGDVTEHTIALVITQMLHLANLSRRPIHLVISTYGGSADEMFSLYDTIKFLPCPVYTIALGKVMSAGVLLLASGEKGKRLIGRSARLMIHPVAGGIEGNVFEIANQVEEHKRLQSLMIETLVKETSMTRQVLDDIIATKLEHFIVPEDAIRLGIVDKIIG